MKEPVDPIPRMVAEYLRWLRGKGGSHPADLLARAKTPSERSRLLKGFEDVHVIWSLTSPLVEEAEYGASCSPDPYLN